MRIVPDTNVLISGIYFSGLPGKILQAWRSHKFQLCFSPEILAEYLNVAERLATRYAGIEFTSVRILSQFFKGFPKLPGHA